jgi:GntR family transcriptional repressor for pyruvate dehydrogenase complex
VSRLTLRAGLAKVASMGLIEVKQGSGYRVQDFRRIGGPDLLPGIADLAKRRGEFPAVAAELLRVRRHLARAVLERLAEARGDGCPARVGEAVAVFARTVEEGAGSEALARADLAVLAALLDATGSPVLALCLNPISAVVAGMPALREAMYAEPRGNVEGWRLLLAWLLARPADLIETIVGELERRDKVTLRRLTDGKKRKGKR